MGYIRPPKADSVRHCGVGLLRRYGSSQKKWGEGGQVRNLTLQKTDFPVKEAGCYTHTTATGTRLTSGWR